MPPKSKISDVRGSITAVKRAILHNQVHICKSMVLFTIILRTYHSRIRRVDCMFEEKCVAFRIVSFAAIPIRSWFMSRSSHVQERDFSHPHCSPYFSFSIINTRNRGSWNRICNSAVSYPEIVFLFQIEWHVEAEISELFRLVWLLFLEKKMEGRNYTRSKPGHLYKTGSYTRNSLDFDIKYKID
jgi:hypothetical protein